MSRPHTGSSAVPSPLSPVFENTSEHFSSSDHNVNINLPDAVSSATKSDSSLTMPHTGSVPNPMSAFIDDVKIDTSKIETTSELNCNAHNIPPSSSLVNNTKNVNIISNDKHHSGNSNTHRITTNYSINGPPRIATSGGIRHNVIYNQSNQNNNIQNSNQSKTKIVIQPIQKQQQLRKLQSPVHAVSDTCSVSTHYTQQSSRSNSSQGSNNSSQESKNSGNSQNDDGTQHSVKHGHANKSPRLSSNSVPKRYQANNSVDDVVMNSSSSTSTPTTATSNDGASSKQKATNQTSSIQQLASSSNSTSTKNNHRNNIKDIDTTNATVTSTNSTITPSSSSPTLTTERRQKRLERNRESARLSRRRRKQYLEILEDRVNFLSQELDSSRRSHVLNSTGVIKRLRLEKMLSFQRHQHQQQELMKNVDILNRHLNRMSDELKVSITFGKEYIKSLVVPPTLKFMMWLTLQNDVYYRGGRAASERLSAARIGEKMLSHGHTQVSPANGMWPLFCNEVCLSYDQEERIRSFQKDVITKHETWLYRHGSYGSQYIIQSLHDAILGSCELVRKRENNVMNILTDEQKMKLMVWKMEKMEMCKDDKGRTAAGDVLLEKLTRLLTKKVNVENDKNNTNHIVRDKNTVLSGSSTSNQYGTSMETDNCATTTTVESAKTYDHVINEKNHDAANLYILNHQLSSLSKSSLPMIRPVSTDPSVLKRLSRRPSFESLAAVHENEASFATGSKGKKGMKHMERATSSGSLKRTMSEMSCDENGGMSSSMQQSSSCQSLSSIAITPEAAQAASSQTVRDALGTVSSLIPAMEMNLTIAENSAVEPMPSFSASANHLVQAEQSTTHGIAVAKTIVFPNNQYHQQPSTSMQQLYQPSSIQIDQPTTQYSNNYSSTHHQHGSALDVSMHSMRSQGIESIPNTIQSYDTATTQGPYSTLSAVSYSNPLSTIPAFSSSHQHQGQVISNNETSWFTTGSSNRNASASLHSTSLPIMKCSSFAPSPIFMDQSSQGNNMQQYQNQNQNQGDNMDMILDDSMLQPYDVGGGSYYNVSNQAADDSLFDFTEADWVIGEGTFLD